MTNTIMKMHAQSDSCQSESLGEPSCAAPAVGFKRLALPAVAAAVQSLKGSKPRKPAHGDWPPLLRREGITADS